MNNARTFRYLEVVLLNGVKPQNKEISEDNNVEYFEYDWLNDDTNEKRKEK